jgi:multidrug resistance efflux pump
LAAAFALAELDAQAAMQRVEGQRLSRSVPIDRRMAEIALAQATTRVLRARATMRQRLVEFGMGHNTDSILASYPRGTHVGLDAVIADVEAAEGDVAAARAQVAHATLAPLDITKQGLEERRIAAALAERRVALTQRVLVAPAAGVVLTDLPERLVGSALREGETALEIGDIGAWRATISVQERDVHRLRAGDRAFVDIAAIAALRDEPIRARVVSVAAEPFGQETNEGVVGAIDPTPPLVPGRYRVTLDLNRQQIASLGLGVIRRGYGVRATIVTRRARAILLLREWMQDKLGRGP